MRDPALKRHIEIRDYGADYGQPKVVICETVSAISLHLRLDDGERKLGGGLDTTKILCNAEGKLATNGWDTEMTPPPTPAVASARDLCSKCRTEWEKLWVKWEKSQ